MKIAQIIVPGIYVLVILAFLAGSVQAEEQALVVRLVSERSKYMLGERMYFSLYIENISDVAVTIPSNWRTGDTLLLEIDGNPDLASPFRVFDTDLYGAETLVLQPKAVYQCSFDLSPTYPPFDTPNRHKVRAIFQVEYDGTKKMWKGKVVSDWTEFEIVAPSTDADKAAYALLDENSSKKIWAASEEVRKKVMNEYAGSDYARFICEWTACSVAWPYKKEDLPQVQQYRAFAQQHWPDDITVSVIDAYTVAILSDLGKTEEATKLLDEILKKPQPARVLHMLRRTVREYNLTVVDYKALGLYEDGYVPLAKQEPPQPGKETVPVPDTTPPLPSHLADGSPLYIYVLIAVGALIAGGVAYIVATRHKKRP